ncbi:MAG: asparagine synthase (glutamine-hydrolyzing) [Deltaproteobacteria bacterium]|nr:asparagine synthase (glutamine-hydrolyzing) [Deltaproteobacteria bacterium]
MCGICGILNFDGHPVDGEVLHAMTDLLRHRGPDDEGYFLEGGIGLGFRRLAIIDLSGGRQPMTNEDGAVQVVFNGEIYNFRELRAQLQKMGHTFKTSSDTEVIVHGYEAWGPEVVQHLNGMFALAVWNRRNRELFLARDRLGIKPLFYTRTRDSLSFASEIKSLLVLPGIDPAVNDQAVFDYFSQHFVPGAKTIYREIRQLQSGETLLVKHQALTVAKYWRPTVAPGPERPLEDWCDELRQRLLEAVGRQLVADVPLGVFLSGGLDSSAITAAMARTGVQEIRTFNVGFDVAKYDETDQARAVSQYLGTSHETFRLTAAATDLLPKLLWHLDEPLADATIIPTYLLSQATRRRVTVALSGEGGDELFAGYTQYQGLKLNRGLGLLPRWLRGLLAGVAGRLPGFGSARLGYLGHRLERIAATSLFPLFEGYTRKVAFFTPEMQQRLFSPDFRWQTETWPYLEEVWAVPRDYPGLDPLVQANLADLSVYLPDGLLAKVDRMSMACSLEVRVPLLDHTLVEFALSMPMDLKLKRFRTKHVLRRALEPWLPPAVLSRRKRGFNPPLEFWLQQHLPDYAREHRLIETLRDSGYFNVAYVEEMAAAHVKGVRDYGRQLWALLVFAVWWRRVRGRPIWQE